MQKAIGRARGPARTCESVFTRAVRSARVPGPTLSGSIRLQSMSLDPFSGSQYGMDPGWIYLAAGQCCVGACVNDWTLIPCASSSPRFHILRRRCMQVAGVGARSFSCVQSRAARPRCCKRSSVPTEFGGVPTPAQSGIMLVVGRGSSRPRMDQRRMNRKSDAPNRDLTGLVCTAAMGLLILLAWMTLPALPPAHLPVPAVLPAPVNALADDLLGSVSPPP